MLKATLLFTLAFPFLCFRHVIFVDKQEGEGSRQYLDRSRVTIIRVETINNKSKQGTVITIQRTFQLLDHVLVEGMRAKGVGFSTWNTIR
jgi:hypothetical protein